MRVCHSCLESLNYCLENKTFAIARLYNTEQTMDIHIHDCYEIYYSVSGGKQFLIDNCLYDIAPGDIFFINNYETHHLHSVEQEEHERIIIHIHPEYLRKLCTDSTDLDYCFSYRQQPGCNKCSLTQDEQKRLTYLIHKLESENQHGQDLLDYASFIKLMVFLSEIYLKQINAHIQPSKGIKPTANPDFLDDIISYINQNLTADLSTESLAKQFSLAQSYMCNAFKSRTGTSIKRYIVAQRITYAKSLLSSGHSTVDACEMSGFNDYSNFYRAFTKTVGISPGKYATLSKK